MYIQKIFKAGNSAVVAIPSQLRQRDLRIGAKVAIAPLPQGDGFIVRTTNGKTPTAKQKTTQARKDFDKWLSVFMAENEEILDELALR